MDRKMIAHVLGRILMTEAFFLLVPAVVAVICSESVFPFLCPAAILLLCGWLLGKSGSSTGELHTRDGFLIVAVSWILMSFFGALPFVFSGDIPSLTDAFFETVSGFTTTGSTVLTDVESLSSSGLFWRSFLHWIGGMGILVFVMAVLPMHDGRGMALLRAEMPGPDSGKLVSRMGDMARILYLIYSALTVLLIGLLLLGGMPLFDAMIHAFGTAGTGGFSCRNLSVAAYESPYLETVLGIFMLIFGVNFNVFYLLLMKRVREAFHSEELKWYGIIVLAATVLIALDISGLYRHFGESLRTAFFQVSSIITTTGYSTADFNLWPSFSKTILLLLMFIGGCSGSTAGGLKIVRIVVYAKASLAQIRKLYHPRAVSPVILDGHRLSDEGIRETLSYLALYVFLFMGSFFLLSLEKTDGVTVFSAVAACFNNVGPGFGEVGPLGNFSGFSVPGKLILALDMLAGRLEIYPMLLLFSPYILSCAPQKKKI